MDGIVLIDKPGGCTSHDVVNRWRQLAGTKRVGHLGTLDPMATGLLALITGRATRLAQFFGGEEKTYLATIRFGFVSDTFDAEGEVVATGASTPGIEAIERVAERFRAEFVQMPPPFSAKKIKGVPAYKLARAQKPVDLDPVRVFVRRLGIESLTGNDLHLTIACSAGTYIRSLAHDMGRELGCGAILKYLRRTELGCFSIARAKTLDELASLAQCGRLLDAVIPAGELLPQFPAEHFTEAAVACIRQGRDFRTSPFVVRPGAETIRALSRSGDLIAIGKMRMPNLYHPSVVL